MIWDWKNFWPLYVEFVGAFEVKPCIHVYMYVFLIHPLKFTKYSVKVFISLLSQEGTQTSHILISKSYFLVTVLCHFIAYKPK